MRLAEGRGFRRGQGVAAGRRKRAGDTGSPTMNWNWVSMTKKRVRRPPRVCSSQRMKITGTDFADVRDLLLRQEATIERIQTELLVQFQRIAEIQAQLDSQQRPNGRSKECGAKTERVSGA